MTSRRGTGMAERLTEEGVRPGAAAPPLVVVRCGVTLVGPWPPAEANARWWAGEARSDACRCSDRCTSSGPKPCGGAAG